MEINKPISSAIVLIITLLIVFLFVVPQYQEGVTLENDLNEKQIHYNGESEYFNNINSLDASVQSRSSALQKVNSALPASLSLSPLIYFFKKTGDESGLVVQSVVFSQINPSASNQDINVITFKINLLGNYQGLKTFVAALDTSARLFEINDISFTSLTNAPTTKQTTNQQQTYNFSLEAQTNTY